MGCRYYDVFNFWKNTELGTYCVEEDKCNTNMYGTCDSGLNRRGWTQFGGNVSITCKNNGKITYELLGDNTSFSSYEAIVLDDGVTFDGNNKTIKYGGSSTWPGLFTFIKRDYQIKVTIKNVTIDLGNGKLGYGQGSILGNSTINWDNGGDFANYNITIENCHVKSGKMNNYCGGIVGQGFCSNSDSEGSIVNCSNSCSVSGTYSGGICASNCGKYGKLEVRSCWNTGTLKNAGTNGGIMGSNTGSDNNTGHVFVFNCLIEWLVCRPVEGMRFRAVVKNVTKAGIRAEINEPKSPVVVFIARDHHYKSAQFSKLNEGDDINVRVIGIRYELNDEYISIIGELVEKKIRVARVPKPKIIIEGKEV